MTQTREILPTQIQPTHYTLYFHPKPEESKFIGKTTIELECNEPTDKLVLNMTKMSEIQAKVINKKDNSETQLSFTENVEKEEMTFFGCSFEKGEYQVIIEYIGQLRNDQLLGYYKSSYQLDGETKYICTTQCEPVSARRAFPCFDEPAIKATFDIILNVPKNDKCFSNMPIESEEFQGERKIVKFKRSVKMSTYLVTFINGEFESYTDETESGVKLGFHFSKAHKNVLKFPIEILKKILTLYEKLFKIPFPLPKCDWVALPDFDSGAMENWGIITSREAVFCLKENASFASFLKCTRIICHEIAHMWFGNLVTMKWWNDLWLNEGFASYMGDFCGVMTLFPEWNMDLSSVVETMLPALETDGCSSTHPISVPIFKAKEIDSYFDLISYNKGCELVKMIVTFVGFEKFIEGITLYLKKYQYANAESDEMWTVIGDHCGVDLKEIVQEWTYEPGFPLITMELKENKLTMKQERCGCANDQLWKVPMVLSCGEYQQQFVLKEKEVTIEWNHPYVIGNTKASGFYRTIYSSEMYEVLKKQEISQKELLVIVDDLFAAMKMGKAKATDYLSFISSLKPFTSETYYLANKVVSHLNTFEDVFKNESLNKFITQQKKRLFTSAIETLGMKVIEKEPILNSQMRALCLSVIEIPELIEEAKNYIREKSIGKCPAEMRTLMINLAAKYADKEIYDGIVDIYLNGETPEIKRMAVIALSYVKDETIFKNVVDFINTTVRKQDFWVISVYSLGNPSEIVAEWFEKDFEEIDKKFIVGMAITRNRIIKAWCGRYSSMERYERMKKYFEEHQFPTSQVEINTGLENMMNRIHWIERDLDSLLKFIN